MKIVEYIDVEKLKSKPSHSSKNEYPEDVIIIPFVDKIAEVLREALNYGKSDATGEVKRDKIKAC